MLWFPYRHTDLTTEFMCTVVVEGSVSNRLQGRRTGASLADRTSNFTSTQLVPSQSLANASIAAWMGSENWPSPKTYKSYYSRP